MSGEFYVPVALSDVEAVAVKSAATAVALSMPGGPVAMNHPLLTAALKIEAEYRKARDEALGAAKSAED